MRESEKKKSMESSDMEQTPETLENGPSMKLDDDGGVKRTGTLVTSSAHMITAVIGSGGLSLAWAIAQLGWVAGVAFLLVFSIITYTTSTLLADSYRSPDQPVNGNKNYTYMDVVRFHLGRGKAQLCGLAQYGNLIGVTIGYTITASISMVAVLRSNCFHKHGHHVKCSISYYPYMIIFAAIQIILSQIPNFHELSWLSVAAAVMSFTYSSIGIGLSIAKVKGGGHARTSLTGVTIGVDVSIWEKIWKCFQAIGDIAFAYGNSTGTLTSPPPEKKVVRKALLIGVSTTTTLYALRGCIGYAAFGNKAPRNFLTGFGFYEPFWLIDFAYVCITIHLICTYQLSAQPIFGYVEKRCSQKWPENKFITTEHRINVPICGTWYINLFRLVWRTAYIIVTVVIAMIFPFFNKFLGLTGAISFYPLTVYFPIEMHIAQSKIPKYSFKWMWLQILSWACMILSLAAAAGSILGLIQEVNTYKPFKINMFSA